MYVCRYGCMCVFTFEANYISVCLYRGQCLPAIVNYIFSVCVLFFCVSVYRSVVLCMCLCVLACAQDSIVHYISSMHIEQAYSKAIVCICHAIMHIFTHTCIFCNCIVCVFLCLYIIYIYIYNI